MVAVVEEHGPRGSRVGLRTGAMLLKHDAKRWIHPRSQLITFTANRAPDAGLVPRSAHPDVSRERSLHVQAEQAAGQEMSSERS